MAKNVSTEQTWTNFKQVFAEEYHELVEETKVTSGDDRFYLANDIQDIGRALEHLSMASVEDKYIVTNITKAAKLLTRKNASLTAQLSNTINPKLDISKKLNIKPTQDLEEKGYQKRRRGRRNFRKT